MGGVLTKKSPKAPDPYQTASAQTASNKDTAAYNAAINRVNQYTPFGNSVYTQTGTDSTGAPIYRNDVTLTPEAQKQLDNQLKQNDQLSGLGFNLADQAGKSLANGIDVSKLPSLSSGPSGYGDVQTSIAGGNDFQQSAKDTRDAIYNQARSRLDPQWQWQQDSQDAKLANMGVMFGTGAYGKAQTQLDQAKNDAYNQANFSSIIAGNDEQQRLFQDALQQGQFANSAQAQKYGQALSNSQFRNQARAQGLQEQTSLRDLPLNELNALRGATQIQNPNFSPVPQANAQGTDISGNIYKSYDSQAANYNNKLNGLYSLASIAAMASDRRVKTDIKRISETPIMKLPIYAFRYVWGGGTRVGVMAQDVLKIKPSAVSHNGKFMLVDYRQIA